MSEASANLALSIDLRLYNQYRNGKAYCYFGPQLTKVRKAELNIDYCRALLVPIMLDGVIRAVRRNHSAEMEHNHCPGESVPFADTLLTYKEVKIICDSKNAPTFTANDLKPHDKTTGKYAKKQRNFDQVAVTKPNSKGGVHLVEPKTGFLFIRDGNNRWACRHIRRTKCKGCVYTKDVDGILMVDWASATPHSATHTN